MLQSDIEIARSVELKPIWQVADLVGLSGDDLVLHGKHIAKVPIGIMKRLADRPDGKLILVTAATPPPKGAGKTTATIGLAQSLVRIGHRAMVAIREPSLGPCMGMKGGAAGGGYSQVLPMEEINLHFTGDLHAVTMAHNLCAALVDNHLHQNALPEIHPRRVVWKRVIDMNDRSLRHIVIGMMDQGIHGVMREDGFDITAASEIMAILCLAENLSDLKRRIGNIIVGYDSKHRPVAAREIGMEGAISALLKNAMNPNLVQTTEGTPAFVHGGPFANIAHGCNTLTATRIALKLADFVVTEAGFGADLGAEKFFDIKCRIGKLNPSAAVVVVPKSSYDCHGLENILKHVNNIRSFNVPAIVAINRFMNDDSRKLDTIRHECEAKGIEAFVTDFRESGGDGGIALAERISKLCTGTDPPPLQPLYRLDAPLCEKIETIARKIYGAGTVDYSSVAEREIQRINNLGYGGLPVCMAKTPLSLTDNPKIPGCPKDFTITVTNARVSAGAGFVVVSTGNVMTMPGLPKEPAALKIDISDDGAITGLF
ncbi:MAG: formate--tetrahydrofolate ligase [Pirellulales bacterium]|nr:formate--tetrahydrofolate ligase [Pirellulales bacterium]